MQLYRPQDCPWQLTEPEHPGAESVGVGVLQCTGISRAARSPAMAQLSCSGAQTSLKVGRGAEIGAKQIEVDISTPVLHHTSVL